MAEKDIAEKTLISLNDVFADIYNGLLFKGKQIITADELTDAGQTSQYKSDDDILHEQERDTSKLWNGLGVNLILFGIENQTQPDKDMPFRLFSYDGASYRSQLLKKEEQEVNGEKVLVPVKERYPVISIVLYFGSEKWNHPKNLVDCFTPPLPDNEVTNILRKYINDYKVTVFDIPRLTKEDVKLFHSDFRIVADYFVNSKDDSLYKPDDAVITHVDELLKLMKVLTGDNRYEEIAVSFTEWEKKEGVTMCEVLDAREARGFKNGEARGRADGEARIIRLINWLNERGRTADVTALLQDEGRRAELLQEYEAMNP